MSEDNSTGAVAKQHPKKEKALHDLPLSIGEDKFQHYQWSLKGREDIALLSRVIKGFAPNCWETFIPLANRALIERHERDLLKKYGKRIGEHANASPYKNNDRARLTPILERDIKRIRGHKSGKDPLPAELDAKVALWIDCCSVCLPIPEDSLDKFNSLTANQRNKLALTKDKYGLLVPSIALDANERPELCRQCHRPIFGNHLDQSASSSNRHSAQHDPAPGRGVASPKSAAQQDANARPSSALSYQPPQPPSTSLSNALSRQSPQPVSMSRLSPSLPRHSSASPVRYDDEADGDCFNDRSDAELSNDGADGDLSNDGAEKELRCDACDEAYDCKLCRVHSQYNDETTKRLFAAAHEARSVLPSLFGTDTADAFLHSIQFASAHFVSASVMPSNVSQVAREDADVLVVSKEDMANPEFVPEKPCLVKESFEEPETITPEFYADILEKTYGDHKMSVRQHSNDEDDEMGTNHMQVTEFVKLLRGQELAREQNALSLRHNVSTSSPFFTRCSFVQLLRILINKYKAKVEKKAEKQTLLNPFDVGSCIEFDLVGLPGAFSGPHRDVMGGTWLRNLCGRKLWWLIDSQAMNEEDWEEFNDQGPTWQPRLGLARAVLLEPGDVLVMPHTISPIIHAVLTLETCIMTGGAFWDERSLKPLLKYYLDLPKHWITTNEQPPQQMREVFEALKEYLETEKKKGREKDPELLQLVGKLLNGEFGCICKNGCSSKSSCSCLEQGVQCTALCRDHLSGMPANKRRKCMTA